MHVHIAFAGKEPDPTLNEVEAIPEAIDKVIIFYGKSEKGEYERTADYLCEKLNVGKRTCEKRTIKPFDFLNVVDSMYDIYEKYKEECPYAEFSVDITTGTNLTSAAACTTAFFTNASVYYMSDARLFPEKSLKELLIPIQSPKIPDVNRLGGISKDILKIIADEQDQGHEVTNSSIAAKMRMKPQAVVYHIKRLEEAGLVAIERGYTSKGKVDNRKKLIKIKREGRFVLRWV